METGNILTYCIECLYVFFVVFCTLGFVTVVRKRETARSSHQSQRQPKQPIQHMVIPISFAPPTFSTPVVEARNGIKQPIFNRDSDGVLQSIIVPLADLTILQLRNLASRVGLTNYSRFDKPQLISYLETGIAPQLSQTTKAKGFTQKNTTVKTKVKAKGK